MGPQQQPLWLGPVNILLGLFNLLPGFPLDRGRALLWAATANLRLATRWAAWLGQAVAWLLISAGILMVVGVGIPFLGTGLLGGHRPPASGARRRGAVEEPARFIFRMGAARERDMRS